MGYYESANKKVTAGNNSKYDNFFDIQLSSSKITSNYIMLVFLDFLISEEEGYASEIKKIFTDVLDKPGFLSLTNGNFYPVIKEMKEKGYIRLNGKTKGKAKYYEITKKREKFYSKLKKILLDEINKSINFYKGMKELIY